VICVRVWQASDSPAPGLHLMSADGESTFCGLLVSAARGVAVEDAAEPLCRECDDIGSAIAELVK
jgi:hypothetical protein